MVITSYGYACGARAALDRQVARRTAMKTPEQVAAEMLRLRRMALLIGRPVPSRDKTKD